MKPRWLLEAAGASLLLLLPYFAPLVVPQNISIYHHRLPLTNVIGGLLLDLAGLTALSLLLVAGLARLPSLPRQISGACLAGLAFWRFAGLLVELLTILHSNLESSGTVRSALWQEVDRGWTKLARLLALGIVLLCAALARWQPKAARRMVDAAHLGLGAFAFSLLWIVPKLCYAAMVRSEPRSHSQIAARPTKAPQPRIVWILFDELSYDLVFDHRPGWQTFPHFYALHSTSVSFANLLPAGYFTDRILPSLLAGVPIQRIRSTVNGDLSYLDETQHKWRVYDPQDTLIGLANAEGWNPGIAGWYNPYCRIFASVVAACSWRPGIQVDLRSELLGANEDRSALQNALAVPRALAVRTLKKINPVKTNLLDQNIRDYRSIMQQASALIQNDQIRFVFVHLPVPHPPGIFNRATHELSEGGDYLDNLSLSDDTLGTLLREIADNRSTNQTTVIVSSDHSWRVPLWRGGTDWTREEESVSHGQFDPRPVLLIHFPRQSSDKEILTQMPLMTEHDMIAAMLKNRVRDAAGLERFLSSALH